MRVIATGILSKKKPFVEEVAAAMGKDVVDAEAIDKASDILKMLKFCEVLREPFAEGKTMRGHAMLTHYREDGTLNLYKKVLSGRRTHG